MRYYADSCIWIDFLEDRYPTNLFEECLIGREELLISDVLIDELYRYELLNDMKVILTLFDSEKLLRRVIATENQRSEAKKISTDRNIPMADALHTIIARDYHATLVTRDKHFLLLRDICKIELL